MLNYSDWKDFGRYLEQGCQIGLKIMNRAIFESMLLNWELTFFSPLTQTSPAHVCRVDKYIESVVVKVGNLFKTLL